MKILNNYVFIYELRAVIILVIFIYIFYKANFLKIASFILLVLFFLMYFFRIPQINPKKDKSLIFSPCYGRVKEITKVGDYLQIAIFINVTDPHVQYIPYEGVVNKVIYKKGEFNPAYMIKKGKYNEKMIYHINTIRGNIIVSQIAGVIARTIVPFVKEKQIVEQNEELGLIKLGSRCDIFIPTTNPMKVLVKKGDYVKGTFTKLIEFLN